MLILDNFRWQQEILLTLARRETISIADLCVDNRFWEPEIVSSFDELYFFNFIKVDVSGNYSLTFSGKWRVHCLRYFQ